jgi:1,2-dihydroxy-3-keto-5-methylthiopentene dioxygenase
VTPWEIIGPSNTLQADPRQPHDSNKPVPLEALSAIGVIASRHEEVSSVDELAKNRGYKNRDVIKISPSAMGDVYEDKIKMFFNEHLHEDEEIRYILDGAGYFDVRSKADNWIRMKVEKGDLVILPAGIWHRFTVDETDYIQAMRLFKDEPKWTPLNRTEQMEENPVRKEYVHTVLAES